MANPVYTNLGRKIKAIRRKRGALASPTCRAGGVFCPVHQLHRAGAQMRKSRNVRIHCKRPQRIGR